MIVQIRYIQLTRQRIVARAGAIAAVGVVTDAKQYRWTLGARHGVHSGPVLRFRAPSRPGTLHARALRARPLRSRPVVVGRASR